MFEPPYDDLEGVGECASEGLKPGALPQEAQRPPQPPQRSPVLLRGVAIVLDLSSGDGAGEEFNVQSSKTWRLLEIISVRSSA